MRGFSHLLSLSLLTFIILGLSGAMTASAQEKERPREGFPKSIIICDLFSPYPQRYRIAVTDLVVVSGEPGPKASKLPDQIANNLNYLNLFDVLDKRSFLETDHSVGLDEKSKLDYKLWTQIGADFLIKGTINETASTLAMELRLFDVLQERPMLAKHYQGTPGEARKMINQFSNAVLEAITGEPGVFGSQIIFVAGDKSKKSVMMTEFGGDDVIKIAGHEGGPSTQPTMGPGGRKAWIHRNVNKWELLVDGEVISSGPPHLSPAFKPDGTVAAAFQDQSQTAIYTFTGQGKKTFLTGEKGINVSPTFSPDGSQMAFVSDKGAGMAVYVSSAEGGPATRLTDKDWEGWEPPTWRLQSSLKDWEGWEASTWRLQSSLYVSASTPRSWPSKATDPAWSPTGEYIVYVTRETDICIIRPDGGGHRQLTGCQGRNYRPSFSPDGRLIVFASDRGGKMQLYVMSVNGSHRARLLLPDFKGSQDLPYWSPTRPKGD